MLKKMIVAVVVLVMGLAVSVTAGEKGTKSGSKTSVTTSSSNVSKNQTLEIPSLFCTVSNESEKDKFNRMVQFIKETNPKPFVGSPAAPKPESPFCKQFMDDLLQMRTIEAIEPDFVINDMDIVNADKNIKRKLNLNHCEDIEHYSIIPPDVNPLLYRRGTLGFNYISDLGGPPYRFYDVQLFPDKKNKYPILYYNATEFFDKKYGKLSSGHTGFARLDLKKCEIMDEKNGRSEISTLSRIGRNVLVRYKEKVYALVLDYKKSSGSYSLELKRFDIPITKGIGDCLWNYYKEKGSNTNNQQ